VPNFNIFWFLLVGHALCDYPLQGDFLAKGKNHQRPLPGVPWLHCLIAHALIHSGAVLLVTGSMVLALLEFFAHAVIDYLKCADWFDYEIDQILHILCKMAWFVIYIQMKMPLDISSLGR